MKIDEKKKSLLKQLDYFTYIKGSRKVFLDAVEFDAMAIATTFDPYKSKERYDRAVEIEKSYSESDRPKFIEITQGINGILMGMLDNFGDHLGEIYMGLPGDKKSNRQYFTPYEVSKLMARITLGDKPTDNKIVTLNEPTCGSGGMVVAAADVWTEQGFNYSNNALVVANDIDRNCALMSYLQISHLGIPAVIKWQDTLTQKTWDTFFTPAFTLQFEKFKRVYDGLTGQPEM